MDLSFNKIRKIEGLERLGQLVKLYLSSNRIENVSALVSKTLWGLRSMRHRVALVRTWITGFVISVYPVQTAVAFFHKCLRTTRLSCAANLQCLHVCVYNGRYGGPLSDLGAMASLPLDAEP